MKQIALNPLSDKNIGHTLIDAFTSGKKELQGAVMNHLAYNKFKEIVKAKEWHEFMSKNPEVACRIYTFMCSKD